MLIVYESNSKPEAVTHKQVRLENDSYLFYRGGRLAELRMWAPKGADKVKRPFRSGKSRLSRC